MYLSVSYQIFLCLVVALSFSSSLYADTKEVDKLFKVKSQPIITPRLSSKFGPRFHPIRKMSRQHSGLDLAAPMRSHVVSIVDGEVVFVGNQPRGYGKYISIMHKGGYLSLYGHLSEILVNVGDVVKSGQVIGRVGSTGASTGPHLHLEWRKNGKALDPLKYFPFLESRPQG